MHYILCLFHQATCCTTWSEFVTCCQWKVTPLLLNICLLFWIWKWRLHVMFRKINSRGPDRCIGTRVYLQQAVWGILGCPWWCVWWFPGLEPLSAVCLRRTSLHTAEDQTYPDATDIIMPYITLHTTRVQPSSDSFDTTVNLSDWNTN